MTAAISFLALALAQCPQASDEKKVSVTVVVVLASETGNSVDRRLTAIAEEIRKREPKLTSFRLARMESRSLAVDEPCSFKLVDKQQARITVKQHNFLESSKNPEVSADKVVLSVEAPEQGEIVYRSKCGKFLPIVTRFQTAKRERLILALRVQPCNGE